MRSASSVSLGASPLSMLVLALVSGNLSLSAGQVALTSSRLPPEATSLRS
nr:hypothetical protein [Methylophaga sulfidovorans]